MGDLIQTDGWMVENVLENGDRRLKRFEGKRLMILEGSVWLKCLSTRYDVTEASLVRDSLRRHLGVYRMTRLRSKWILAGSSVRNFRCLRTLELQDWNSGLRRFNSLFKQGPSVLRSSREFLWQFSYPRLGDLFRNKDIKIKGKVSNTWKLDCGHVRGGSVAVSGRKLNCADLFSG